MLSVETISYVTFNSDGVRQIQMQINNERIHNYSCLYKFHFSNPLTSKISN